MIGVFVGDDDAVEPIDRIRKSGEAPQRFALPQARIHQQARLGSLEQRAIARTARRENAHAKADRFPVRRRKTKSAAAGIIAKARGASQLIREKFVIGISAGEQIALQTEALERANHGGGNFLGMEELRAPSAARRSAVTASIEACNSSTLKKRPK